MIELHAQGNDLPLGPIARVAGEIRLVGSKSLTNRALLLSALSQGRTKLTNILRSDDTKVMLNALQALGVKIEFDENDATAVTIDGIAGPFAYQGEEPLKLFLGNAGTAMRPLCAALAISQGTFELTGESRMYERPIGILVDALRALGAEIDYLGQEGFPPLRITGIGAQAQDKMPEVEVDGSTSSQFITALMMIGALLPQGLYIKVKGTLISAPYVAMTSAVLSRFGVKVSNHDFKSFEIKPQLLKSPGTFLVEGDATAATYFLAAAAISGEVTVRGVGAGSLQGDAKFVEVLEKMGAHAAIGADYIKVSAPDHGLLGIKIDLNDMPDAAMTLVPMALFTKDPIAISNIGSWRVKETDRIAALATEMRKLGCQVEEGPDYIVVDGNTSACHNFDLAQVPAFDTYNDHRMAMCMSLVALQRQVVIKDYQCCAKTFPDYFERLAALAMAE